MNNLNMTDITPYIIKESSLFSSYWAEKTNKNQFLFHQVILIRLTSEFQARDDGRSLSRKRRFLTSALKVTDAQMPLISSSYSPVFGCSGSFSLFANSRIRRQSGGWIAPGQSGGTHTLLRGNQGDTNFIVATSSVPNLMRVSLIRGDSLTVTIICPTVSKESITINDLASPEFPDLVTLAGWIRHL